jgi:hypothetical protein
MITQDELKQVLSYDSETGVLTRIRTGEKAGSIDKYGYLCIGVGKKVYKAHRLAWLYFYGTFPNGQIDHINQNKTDNRIENLRIVTNSENCQNIKQPRSDNKLKTKGVIIKSKKFYAQIQVRGKKISLGYYHTIEEAAAVYQEAKSRLHLCDTIKA